MKTIKKILLPTDFEESLNVVLEEAVALAKIYKAELHVLHVNVLPIGVPFVDTYIDPEKEHMKSKFDEYVQEKFKMIENNVGNRCRLILHSRSSERVLHGITGYADEFDVDLIIMSSHGRKGFSHFFLGSVAEEVMRNSNIPVLIIKNKKSNFDLNQGKICVPIDFSDFSKSSLKSAIEMAKIVDAEIHLVHVIPNVFQLHVEGSEVNIIKNYPDLIKDTEKGLKKFHKAVDENFDKVTYKVLFGVTAVEIEDYANQNDIHLIYLSSHGLTGIKKFFIGNVAEKIVRMVDCPVLIDK